jgi:hypothetical protein
MVCEEQILYFMIVTAKFANAGEFYCRFDLHHHHVPVPDFSLLPTSNHSFYIVTVRDPYDRTLSSFTYDHPLNDEALDRNASRLDLQGRLAAYKCFPSLEDFVGYIGDNVTDFEYSVHASKLRLRNLREQ